MSAPLDVLRALAQDADILGWGPDGRVYLLVQVPREVVEYLETFDAPTEDDEPAPDEEDREDACVEDEILQAKGAGGNRVPWTACYAEDDEPNGDAEHSRQRVQL